MQDEKEGVFASSGNVFADLSPPDPEARMAKAQLAHAIRSREYGLNQTRPPSAWTPPRPASPRS